MINIDEVYAKIGEDYEKVKKRLCNEEMIKRFVIKFAKDNTYEELLAALAKKDVSSAFRAAHTLKGIAANLGFTKLAKVSSDLTEILRGGELPQKAESLKRVTEEYEKIKNAIER